MALFSLVIPTLRRSDTFRHALATALSQSFEDFEVVVQNNGQDAETEAIVRERNDPRIKHFSSPTILTITENWEAALGNASGEFIMFIGDDDGLLPDACEIARKIFDNSELDIVNWHPFCYYWPDYIHPAFRNRLVATVDYDPHVHVVSSDEQLKRLYNFSIDYSQMPMIYNSFVHRALVERIGKSVGRYFLGQSPDVTSGIINAAHSSRFAKVSRPLSITGLSGHSTGHNVFLSGRAHASSNRVERDLGPALFHPLLVPSISTNLELFIANEMLLLRDAALPQGRTIEVDFRQLIERMAANINNRPDYYQETLAAIRALATKHDVDLAGIAIRPPIARRQAPKCGATALGQRRIEFVIDGDYVGLANIADAVGLMTSLIPKVEDTAAAAIDQIDARTGYRPGETITFGSAGNGVSLLQGGWGEPEQWGTWSIASRARLRLPIDAGTWRPIHAVLKYRAFVVPGHDELTVTCRIGDHAVATWHCRLDFSGSQRIAIPSDTLLMNPVEMEFIISNPRSPAELGISSDGRLLGVGIESLELLSDAGVPR